MANLTKDKTAQRAIVHLYLRLRRARKYFHRWATNQQPQRDLAYAQYSEAHNALESLKSVLWEPCTTPFDVYIEIETLWQRFASALATANVRDLYDNSVHIDDFMLMGVNEQGRASFKDHTTRQYAFLEADGTLEAKGSYYCFFQTQTN